MKFQSILLVLSLSSVAVLHAQENMVKDEPPGRNLRAGLVHDTEATPSKGSMTGIELTYAQKVYPLDQMGLKFGHMSSSSVDHNYVLLFIEDYYPLTDILSVYGSSGVGYMMTDRNDAGNREGLVGALALGLRLDLEGPWSVYTEAGYYFGSQRFWVDGNEDAQRNLQFSLGVRWAF